jgi:4-hydroxy-2-oxoheptanedioate aldolase
MIPQINVGGTGQVPRINRVIELLQAGQAVYYIGEHSGHVLTTAQATTESGTWADYVNIGMEHGAFDMAGLETYMRGLVAAGPTRSGHRTPTVIVEAPVNGTDAANVRFNAWQFRQILGRGVHGIILCQAEQPEAVRAFVESCRYPHQGAGVDTTIASAELRLSGVLRRPPGAGLLGIGTRGRGSEHTAAPIWGVSEEEYRERADPWPLNPAGELLLGVKIESPEGVARCDEILAVPGLGYAELGPGDLSLALGYLKIPDPFPPAMQAARAKVFAACGRNGLAFLEACTPQNITSRLDEGVRVVAGRREETARIGRAHQRRIMPA